jgi:hypothetical protein
MTKFNLADNLADGLFGFHEDKPKPCKEPNPDWDVESPFDVVTQWVSDNLSCNGQKPDASIKKQIGTMDQELDVSKFFSSPPTPYARPSQASASGASSSASSAKTKKATPSSSDSETSANVGIKKTRKPRRRNTSFQQWI